MSTPTIWQGHRHEDVGNDNIWEGWQKELPFCSSNMVSKSEPSAVRDELT
jgi:hypothetical protein